MSKLTSQNKSKIILGRIAILLGSSLAVIGLVMALSGHLSGIALIILGIPLAGAYRIAGLVNIRL